MMDCCKHPESLAIMFCFMAEPFDFALGWISGVFPGSTGVKNLPASAGDIRAVGPIPGSGRSPGGGHDNPPSVLAWRIPWTEEPVGYSVGSCKKSDTTEAT